MIAHLLCFSLAAASAYNIPTTRRAVLAKAAAVAPLAAVFPAFAELRYNTRDNKLIDDYGAAQQPKALFTTAEVTSRAPPRAQAVRVMHGRTRQVDSRSAGYPIFALSLCRDIASSLLLRLSNPLC